MLFKRSFIGACIGGVAVVLGAAAVAVPVAAAADATDLVITGGAMSGSAVTVGNFGGLTLNGAAQTSTATIDPFSVTDGRGSGAGWHITAQASRFAEHNGTAYVTSGKMLPLDSLAMTAPTVAADGTSSPVPSITAGGYTIDGTAAVKIATAALDTGMGKYNFTPGTSSLTLSVPATAYAKTYRSDVTFSVVTGP